MKLFQHFTADEVRRHFVYRGWFAGLVPVYIGDLRDGSPNLSVRNGIPELALDIVEGLFATFALLAQLCGRDIETTPLLITERLDGAPLGDL